MIHRYTLTLHPLLLSKVRSKGITPLYSIGIRKVSFKRSSLQVSRTASSYRLPFCFDEAAPVDFGFAAAFDTGLLFFLG